MSQIIRADTDQLRAVARQMRAAADQIAGGHDGMQQAMSALDATWSGRAHDNGMARWAVIAPKYRPSADGLIEMANGLEDLARRLDDAAAVFGAGESGGGGGGEVKTDSTWLDQADTDKISPAETKMAGVFDRMQNGPDLQIYQVGENEFAVMLQGSDFDQLGGMNPLAPNAFISGMGYSTAFTKAIRAKLLDLARDHPGANVHLVGYSQGGIEAQNLARDNGFWNDSGLHFSSISTYGTPNTFNGPQVEYNYDAPGDLVSNFGTTQGVTLIAAGLMAPSPIVQAMTGLLVKQGVDVHTSAYFDGSSSDVRQQMLNADPPWVKNNPNASSEWVLYTSVDDGDHSWGEVLSTAVAKTVSSEVNTAVNIYNSATETVGDALEGAAHTVGEGVDIMKDAGSAAVGGMKRLFNM